MTQARLQFRWEATDKPADEFGARDWICKYELSIPLDPHDIRREDEDHNKVRDAQVIELGSTKRGSVQQPCINEFGAHYFDAPYRDGAHATWDAPKLGNIPIVCIALDGTVIPKAPPENHLVVTDELAITYKAAFRTVFDRWLNDEAGIPQENIGLIATKAGLQAVFDALTSEGQPDGR